MNMFAEIRTLIAKPSREFKKVYTKTDDIYIIWYTGYAIGLCLQEAEKIKQKITGFLLRRRFYQIFNN